MKNNYIIKNDLVYIELNRKNGDKLYTIIDKDDLKKANSYENTWYAVWCKPINSFYCNGNIKINGKRKLVGLHRFITNAPEKLVVDHRNHDTLNNTKKNLRIVTQQCNNFNMRVKGYHFCKIKNRFIAQIKLNKKQKTIGCYKNEEDAKNAYINAKKQYHIIKEERALC